jgi:hypothetical protein
MKKIIWLLLLLLHGTVLSRAQQMTEKLKYALIESVLDELPTPFAYAKQGADGKYHRQPPMVMDTPTVRLLLLDHPYTTEANFQLVLAREGTDEQTQVMKYFTAADVACMRQQLTASKYFKIDQASIQKSWVTVISLDTVMALNRRLGWRAEYLSGDSLLQRYGSDRTYAIWDIFFSTNHKRALVNTSSSGGWQTSVYVKAGTAWRKEATLYAVVY